MKKRLWATILALCMVLGLLPGTAWADFGPSISEEPPATSPENQNVTWNGWDVQYYCPTPSDAYYELSGGSGVVICYATGNSTSIDIPEQIDGKPVVGLVALGGYGLGVSGANNTVFGDCKQLTSVNIPNSVTHIVDAFRGCTSLTSVTIPASVTYIGKAAFMDCNVLTRVSIPDSVTYIGDGAFAWCRNLTDATIPSNVTTLGCWAFYYTALTDIIIPDAITHIEDGVFADSKLINVNIPAGVTSIGDSAFKFCVSLTNIMIPSSVTSIGNSAFSFCSSLTNVTIPNSVTSIGEGAFGGCGKLFGIQVSLDNATYASVDGVLFSKDKTKLVVYPEGKEGAYVIPSGVTSIEKWAFNDCEGLTNVTIPNGVTSIGESAFSGCKSLANVTISNSVTSIDTDAFRGCESLTNVTIPNNVTNIGSRAFCECKNLTNITIPNSVTSIGERVFAGCSSLTNIAIPNSITSIGNATFYGCESLTNITIPNSVTSIGGHAFYGCRNLANVIIPNSVTSIGNTTFYGCENLTNITIPNSVTSISGDTFGQCSKLSGIQVNPDHPTYASVDGVLFSKDKTKLVAYPGGKQGTYVIPSGVTWIVWGAFRGCKSLTNITIPNSVTSIGSSVFEDCSSLANVTIPNSVTSIGWMAFSDCERLTNVYYSGNKDDWKQMTIDAYNEPLVNATIHYNSTGPDTPDTPSVDSPVLVSISGGKYTDSNGYGAMPTISSTGDTAYIPAGATGLILEFTVPATSDIIFSDNNITYDKCPNPDCIIIDGDCGLTATGASIRDDHKTLYLDFLDGTAKPGTLDITFTCFALASAPGQILTDKNGYVLASNTLHLVVQGNDTPSETGVRVDFFPNGGTITSIKGYTRDQIMQGDPSVPDDILFIDVNSGIAGMMTDENGIISDFPVVEREGYTFDGWWYTDDRDVIYSAYDNEITDFTGMRRVDLSTNFASLADSFGRNVIAKWNKNTGDTDNTHEVWFHWNGGRVTSVLGVSTDHMIYGTLYDSNGNWIYAEGQDEDPSEILGMMITDKSGKLAGLPVIEREGYTFTGWYTMENGGNKITADYTFTGAGQYGRDYLWAHWVPSTDQPGDLTGDNKVTMADVLRLARGAAGYVVLTEQEQKAGDVTGDGKITMADVIRVARYAAGYSPTV